MSDADDNSFELSDFADCVGLPELDAVKVLRFEGWAVQIVPRENQAFRVAGGARPDRVNLVIKDGKVVKAYLG